MIIVYKDSYPEARAMLQDFCEIKFKAIYYTQEQRDDYRVAYKGHPHLAISPNAGGATASRSAELAAMLVTEETRTGKKFSMIPSATWASKAAPHFYFDKESRHPNANLATNEKDVAGQIVASNTQVGPQATHPNRQTHQNNTQDNASIASGSTIAPGTQATVSGQTYVSQDLTSVISKIESLASEQTKIFERLIDNQDKQARRAAEEAREAAKIAAQEAKEIAREAREAAKTAAQEAKEVARETREAAKVAAQEARDFNRQMMTMMMDIVKYTQGTNTSKMPPNRRSMIDQQKASPMRKESQKNEAKRAAKQQLPEAYDYDEQEETYPYEDDEEYLQDGEDEADDISASADSNTFDRMDWHEQHEEQDDQNTEDEEEADESNSNTTDHDASDHESTGSSSSSSSSSSSNSYASANSSSAPSDSDELSMSTEAIDEALRAKHERAMQNIATSTNDTYPGQDKDDLPPTQIEINHPVVIPPTQIDTTQRQNETTDEATTATTPDESPWTTPTKRRTSRKRSNMSPAEAREHAASAMEAHKEKLSARDEKKRSIQSPARGPLPAVIEHKNPRSSRTHSSPMSTGSSKKHSDRTRRHRSPGSTPDNETKLQKTGTAPSAPTTQDETARALNFEEHQDPSPAAEPDPPDASGKQE